MTITTTSQEGQQLDITVMGVLRENAGVIMWGGKGVLELNSAAAWEKPRLHWYYCTNYQPKIHTGGSYGAGLLLAPILCSISSAEDAH